MNHLDLSNQVSVLVAKKAMDMARQQGEAALELLQSASEFQASEGESASDDAGLDVYG